MKKQKVQWTLTVLAMLLSQLSLWTTSFAQGRPDIVWMHGHGHHFVPTIAFSPDGQLLASGGGDNTVKIWRVSDGVLVQTLTGHSCSVRSLAFSPDGQLLASGSAELPSYYSPGVKGEIIIWRVSDWGLIHTLSRPHPDFLIRTVAFSPNGEILAVGGSIYIDRSDRWESYGKVLIWRVSGWQLIHMFPIQDYLSDIWTITFSPDGQLLADAGWNYNTRVWRVSDWELIHVLPTTLSVAFSPDGQFITDGSRFWRVSDWELIRTLTPGIGTTFSPDWRLSIMADQGFMEGRGWYGIIRIFRVSDGALLQTFDEETGTQVIALKFSPDGRFFAYTRIWDGMVVLARNPFWQEGDVNGDGCVNDADLLAVLFAFGGSGGNEDVNGDGVVDDADLLMVLFNFGSGC